MKAFLTTLWGKIALGVIAIAIIGGGVTAVVLLGGDDAPDHTHTEVVDQAVSATCTSIGLTEGKHCSECGEVIVKQNAIPALGHTEVVDEAVETSCLNPGKTEGEHCSVCGVVIVAQTEITKLEHTYDSDMDAVCNVCGTTRHVECNHPTSETVPKQEPTCTEIGYTSSVKCSVCGTPLAYPSVIEALGHTYDNDDDAGCNRCGDTREITHSVGLAYTLNPDGTSFSVTGIGTCTDTDIIIPETRNGYPVTGVYGLRETNITSITIPDSVTRIGDYAFSDCESLTSITIPDGVTKIGDYAFRGCTGLTSITIPDGVTSIGEFAFRGCTGLTSITIPDGVTSIGEYAFYDCTSLTSITIPDSVTSIGEYAFYDCTSLTSITIPDSVTSIGKLAFYGCTSLASITVGGNNQDYKSIDGNLYSKDGKTLIQYAIGKTDTSFTVPDSVTSIGSSAFNGCTGLTSINIPDSVTSIYSHVFSDCTGLTSINVDENNPNYKSIDGNLYSKDGKTLIQYAIGKTDTSFTVPDSVTRIGSSAFYGCTNIQEMTIPFVGSSADGSGSTHFGWIFGASNDSYNKTYVPYSLKKVVITGGASIGDAAFYNCESLTSITIPDSVASIGEFAFRGCTGLTSITIPDSVTSIGERAFEYCTGLTSINIPDSVTSIGDYTFYYCKSLISINFEGTVAKWNAISKGSSWNTGTGNYTVYCTDEQCNK